MNARDELDFILNRLSGSVEVARRHGQDAFGFVFAENLGRAIEVSRNDENKWWIEFWESECDSPVNEITVETPEDAVEVGLNWLSRGESI